MKLNVPHDCYLPAVGRPVEKGEVVEVDEETGASLVAQGWRESKAKKPATTRKRKSKAKAPADVVAPELEEGETR